MALRRQRKIRRKKVIDVEVDVSQFDIMEGSLRYYWRDEVSRCVIRVSGLHKDGKHLLASFCRSGGKWSKPKKFAISDTVPISNTPSGEVLC